MKVFFPAKDEKYIVSFSLSWRGSGSISPVIISLSSDSIGHVDIPFIIHFISLLDVSISEASSHVAFAFGYFIWREKVPLNAIVDEFLK